MTELPQPDPVLLPGVVAATLADLRQDLDDLDLWLKDCSNLVWLLGVVAEMGEIADRVKVVLGTANGKVRAQIADGPKYLPDGRTVSLGTEPKRTMRSAGKVLIRRRIAEKCLAGAQGEAMEALVAAIEMTEEAYASASTLVKAGTLKTLGLKWDDVADTEDREKGVDVQ